MAATANPVVLKNDLRPGVGWAQGLVFSGQQPGDIAIVSLRRTFSGAQPYEALREPVPDDGEMTVEVDGEVSKAWGTGTYVLEIGYQRGEAAGVFLTSFQIAAKSTIINVGAAGDALLAPGGEPIHLSVGANAGIIEISLTEGLRGKTGLGIEDIRSADNGNGTASIFFDMTDGTSKEIIIKIGSLSLEFAGTSTFTATTVANLLASLEQVASVAASASVTGAVVFTATLAASVTSQASVAAAISALVTLAASGAGAAAVSAAISADANLSASANGQATVAGAIANGWALGDFDFDFSGSRYMAQGDYYPAMPALLAALSGTGGTRASSATYTDMNGVLQTAGPDELRRDHDPITLEPLGYLIEGDARTNVIRTNDNTGAASGSPGALSGGSSLSVPAGLTRTISVEIINGISCLRIKITGTTTAAGGIQYRPEAQNFLPAVNGQTWASSFFHQMVKSTGMGSWLHELWNYAAGIVFTTIGSQDVVGLAGMPKLDRRQLVRTLNTSTDAFVGPILRCDTIPSGTVVDVEFVVGMWQLELGSYASSPIRTSGTVVTRAADIPPALPYAQSGEHTLFAEYKPMLANDGAARGVAALDDSSPTNLSMLGKETGGVARARVTKATVIQANINDAVTSDGFRRACLAAKLNDVALFRDGAQVGSDNSAEVPTTSRLIVGGAGGSSSFMGHIKRIAVFPRKLSATEVAAL